MALISLEHVSKVYPKGTRPALDDINLDIDRGDFVFLVGASGSGKTTLLSLLLREEEVTDGEIRVAGNDLRRLSSRQVPHYRRSIGYTIHFFMRSLYSVMEPHTAFAQSSASSTYPHTRSHPAEPRTSLVTYGIAGPGRIIPDQRRQRPA